MSAANRVFLFVIAAWAMALSGCSSEEPSGPVLFRVLDNKRTGLDFTNKLTYSPEFNLFKYMYFYNGSGVGAGDFNNDGKIDLFFGSNQGQNRLYLNTGSLKFKDVTAQAKIPADGGWTTGISVVDINNDGLLDVYVCRVGNYETLKSRNQFLINQGFGKDSIPTFKDEAKAYGLDFSGFSTQAAFFDYDNDRDLDMFLLNHSVHQNNNFRPRAAFQGTYDTLSGDRIYQNSGKGFVDKTRESGINSTAISYGLGVVVSDINLDGYPDLYIGNDFHENDYLYINQKNGTFKEEGTTAFAHTSQYSMGVDAADINNDGLPEIISMDMLPSDPYILKRSLGEDTYDLFHEKIGMGYSHQFTRNNLQYNLGISTSRGGKGEVLFSEIGLYSGVAATDWSWAPLWMDFDNDGYKDLFISNGIPKRMNDIDYVNFVSTGEVQQKITNDDMQGKDMSLIKKFPEIKIPNKFYRNSGNLSFEDQSAGIENDVPNFSNGAVYADLDNDGDLDVVTNNIDDPVSLYENQSADSTTRYVQLLLEGPADFNANATGAKVVMFAGGQVQTHEVIPAKGFLSSMETPLHIGLGGARIDSALVIWPDRTYQALTITADKQLQTVRYREGLPQFDFSILTERNVEKLFSVDDVTTNSGIDFLHQENRFVEFDREPLIPHEISTEGPALAVGDINKDGLDDVFIGAARDRKSAVFLQQASGAFLRMQQPILDADSVYENTDACWADIDKDGDLDLAVTSGGNEFYGNDYHNTPRIYANDGKGNLSKLSNPFGNLYMTASCIAAEDFNGDGYVDFCIGGRAVPWAYGQVPQSYLFLNNRNGSFIDVTQRIAKGLSNIGFITRSVWCDVDGDKDNDLVVSLEWGGIVAFINERGNFTKKVLSDKKGWWNFIYPFDADADGDMDLIAGNLGLNSRLKASPEMPVRLYYNDFDGNGKKEQVLTYYVGGKEIPFANKAELEKQMPGLKKKFLYAEDLAKASPDGIFGEGKLKEASVLTADYFSNAILINNGRLNFETVALPAEAQFTSFRDALIVDANNDSKPDVLLGGNYYGSNIEMGHYDADYGTVLINKGGGKFHATGLQNGLLRGQVRRLKPIQINGVASFVAARNNDSLKLFRFSKN